MMNYDIIIIGGGPAGLTAALYALRANKRVLVIEKATFGGQITFSPKVENIPGFVSLSGNEFAEKLVEQVLAQGADVEYAEVLRIADGACFKDGTVAVIGGGNSALQEALQLSELAKKVYVIQNLDFLTGEGRLAEAVGAKENIEVILGTTVREIKGDDTFRGIVLRREADGALTDLALDGMFVAIGLVPQNEPFANLIETDARGYAAYGEDCATGTPGVFVAGDCRAKAIRQVTTAAADGAVAALAACKYLDEQ